MIQNENTRFTSVTLLGRQDDESVSLPIACRMDSWFHRLARGEKHNEAQRSCICFHESKPIFTVNSQICIDSCQRAMCILLLLSSRLFSCLASECTCAGTLLPWPRRSTISDCLVSTPQSSHEVLIDAKISLYVLVCFIIPSDHASVPYIFLSHETQSKKEIIQVSKPSGDPATLWQSLQLYFEGIAPRGPPLPTASRGVNMTTAGTEYNREVPDNITSSIITTKCPNAWSWKLENNNRPCSKITCLVKK